MFRAVNSSKEDLWRSRLRRFQSSGLSVTRFCQAEQVSAPAFYHWRKRLGTSTVPKATPTFVPVRLTQAAAVEVHLPNGARVCVPPGPGHADSLRVAIETAGRLSGSPDPEADAC
jgi:hypothetical protein